MIERRVIHMARRCHTYVADERYYVDTLDDKRSRGEAAAVMTSVTAGDVTT